MASEYNNLPERDLIRRRATIKGRVTNLSKHIQSAKGGADFDTTGLSIRIKIIEDEFKSFCYIQDALESLASDEDYEKRTTERFEFEETYTAILEQTRKLITANQPVAQITGATHEQATNSNTGSINLSEETPVRLPRMDLPKFSGSYEGWPGFCDAFKSAIDENATVKDAQKLIYLRSCLTGKAAEKVESLETTGANYAVAWDILRRYYDDPVALINKRVQAFFELPACTKHSAAALGALLDDADRHYSALKALKKPFLEAFPIHAIISKLDERTRRRWRERTQGKELPTMEELLEFLRGQRKVLESAHPERESRLENRPPTKSGYPPLPRSDVRHSKVVAYSAQSQGCQFCEGNHYTQACDKFIAASVPERIGMVRSRKLCYNCLRSNHVEANCRAQLCKTCNKRHHTLLHKEPSKRESPPITTTNFSAVIQGQVLLPTAIIHIADRHGRKHSCRALLDSGSQSHFVSEPLVQLLQLERKTSTIPVSGIGQSTAFVKDCVTATIGSRTNNYTAQLEFLVLPRITDLLPTQPVPLTAVPVPKDIRLADPRFRVPSEIDLILGAEIFYQLLRVGQITLRNSSVVLQKTRLGWVVSGKLGSQGRQHRVTCNTSLVGLRNQIERFWTVEEVPAETPLSREEAACEEHFSKHTRRDPASGRYVVKIPFKQNLTALGESYQRALRRLHALEKSLARDTATRADYINFMREYVALGHMSEVPRPNAKGGFFLPHKAVKKENSLTTKLRVVFDASAKSTTGISLNQTMMVGPVIQDDLFSIITRFRSHAYALTADIAKMYRQILVDPADCAYQRILWRESPSEPVRIYELGTVTYGTAAASFLATRTLKQLAIDEGESFPKAAVSLREDFYMDDLLTGASTRAEAAKIRDELIESTKRAGFELRQWASNEPELIKHIDGSSGNVHIKLDLSEAVKTLGVNWDARLDTLSYAITKPREIERITKRTMLSEIASLFDPLGLLGPVVIRAKIMMQTLWQLNASWDESVPQDIYTAWQALRDELPLLERLKFPRNIFPHQARKFELHGFCDASERAFGACIYARSVQANGTYINRLICAKSRVAPLKTQTLPRLELCAAVLLVRLYKAVANALRRIDINRVVFWTDSTIALAWIGAPPHTLKTFVSHRVREIQDASEIEQWRHVPSEHNPADLISRGLGPSEIVSSIFWREGPEFLNHQETVWPITGPRDTEIPELRPIVTLISTVGNCDLLGKYSSLTKLKRVMAYCLRVRTRTTAGERSRELTARELDAALTRIVLLVQREAFAAEMDSLRAAGKLSARFAALSPFLDQEGVLRVGGRLRHADLPYAQRHPALLPKGHHVTELIVRELHDKNYHAGTQATLNATRELYWIVDGKQSVKRVIRRCVKCARARPVNPQYGMGNLPQQRTKIARPFTHTGVDYCGPMFIKETRFRNRARVKVYVAVFICFSTKAVHLEVVGDLTTEAFLAALRRFVSRRGKCSDIYSDNATTFVGADNELRALLTSGTHNNMIARRLATEGITWHFIPPRSPHFGGLWEAAVKSAKHHLTRVVGDTLLTLEGFATYIAEIEAILNSRPLTSLSSDPNDLRALTPGHFLTGDSLMSVPDKDFRETPSGRLSCWEHVQQMQQHFWARWVREYLHEQTVRKKWHKGCATDIKVGDLVILNEDHTTPMHWPLGRITAAHPGADGIVRVVTVKTARGEFRRCVKKISPLPVMTAETT